MVRAWYMNNSEEDQRTEHHRTPPEFIDVKDLYKLTGVEYFTFNPKSYAEDGELESIKRKRGYTYEDELVCSKEALPNYEEKLRHFYTEHLHTEEEIRLCLEGSGYFDVRDKGEQWIRIEVVPGDMLVLPSGIYHRFTLDSKNFIRAKRFFIGVPVWTPHNRPADEMECRQNYLKRLVNGFEE